MFISPRWGGASRALCTGCAQIRPFCIPQPQPQPQPPALHLGGKSHGIFEVPVSVCWLGHALPFDDFGCALYISWR